MAKVGKVDQDSIDELILISQNVEYQYNRAIKLCKHIVDQMQGRAKYFNYKAETKEGKLEAIAYEKSDLIRMQFRKEAYQLHKNYMQDNGLRNGFVKANLNATTLKALAKELYDIYRSDIEFMLNEELGISNN
jgi:hypothetical protein